METSINQQINRAFDMEEQGDAAGAILLLAEIMREGSNDKNEILYEIAKMKFRYGNYKEALKDFMKCNELGNNKEAEELVRTCYYEPNRKEIKDRYEKNFKMLSSYKFYYGSRDCIFEKVDSELVWRDEETRIFIYQGKMFEINLIKELNESRKPGEVIFLEDVIELELISRFLKMTSEPERIGLKNPFYLYFEPVMFDFFLLTEDITDMIRSGRVVFIVGVKHLTDFFCDKQSILPDCVQGRQVGLYDDLLNKIAKRRNLDYELWKEELEKYYLENKDNIKDNIKNGRPKIMFWTSRDTSALQYHIRDCMSSIQELGNMGELIIEKSEIHGISSESIMESFRDFKPDILFLIDHFRFEISSVFFPELYVVSWIQDPVFSVMDVDSPTKLGERDVLLNHLTTWRKLLDIGYDRHCIMIDAPIPANDKLYKPYHLSEKEWALYGCDIALVCHASDDEIYLEEYLMKVNEKERLLIKKIFLEYRDSAYSNEYFFYSEEEFLQYMEEFLHREEVECINTAVMRALAGDLHLWYNQRIYRTIMVDWLLDAGYTNIKLWGDGWDKNKKYAKYAMGRAENGEVLSKIYQAAKINIGNNILTTAVARAWECMLSGGFYLSNWIPEEEDITDIRKILKLGEDVDFFRTKDELLNKVEYYLSHEEDRKSMMEKGRSVALEKMTYEQLMKNMLQTMKEKC